MNFIAWMIVACEIGFWIVIALGLFTRYVRKKDKLGLFFLALTPVIDLILLVITGLDLYWGATATTAHAIAAVYIGISIGFGKSMIKWADERFRYYVTKEGSKPIKRYGMEFAKHYLKGWGRHLLSYLIGSGILAGLIFFINDSSRTEAFSRVLLLWTLVLGIDLIITISYFIWPRKKE
ncbi:hypothetical protein EDD68_1181 [Melghiribacillus thermohalophilus]|uniref:Membrane protein YmcC n=1 Tax=Melghiribacillus thermohalophilus TaxID=1324956 RepID=A0A4R3MSG2_9BACI|nr:hypothetical protein [Melghiribacillus thermohalophilus]TCT19318.1 hypothetical protein EDD68_1181 [Melghiribacillus thermohalophilus]